MLAADKRADDDISIHVPREGDDTGLEIENPDLKISIHVPREGDDGGRKSMTPFRETFLSTSPARGTTVFDSIWQYRINISIHVPREGDDMVSWRGLRKSSNFYPRPPRGGRPM